MTTFRISNDETSLRERPHRDAYRCGVGWAIDIDKIEDLQGLAGYGGRVEVTIDADDCRINLTPLETIREEWRQRMEARESAASVRTLHRSPVSDDV